MMMMKHILLIALLVALGCVSLVSGNQNKFFRLAKCFNDTEYPSSADTQTCLGNVSNCFDDTTIETVKTCIEEGIAEALANSTDTDDEDTDGDGIRLLASHSNGGGGQGNGGAGQGGNGGGGQGNGGGGQGNGGGGQGNGGGNGGGGQGIGGKEPVRLIMIATASSKAKKLTYRLYNVEAELVEVAIAPAWEVLPVKEVALEMVAFVPKTRERWAS